MYVTVVDAPVGKWLGMDALVCGLCWTPRFVALVIELESLGHSFCNSITYFCMNQIRSNMVALVLAREVCWESNVRYCCQL